MEQCVVERFTAIFGSLHEHLQIFHNLTLSAEIVESQRAQGVLKVFFGRIEILLFSYVKIVCHILLMSSSIL